MIPTEDLTIASEQGLTFHASIKRQRGGRWEEVLTGVALDIAYQRALSEDAFERAVFVQTETGGRMYWTSRFPTTFNSVVLAQALQERHKKESGS
jgi:hypothetical protein